MIWKKMDSQPLPVPAESSRHPGGDRRLPRSGGDRVYGLTFWMCYLANTALMIAISILFRYADFISFLGGSEMQLGLVVGVGMVGALTMRLFQGVGIDRYGPRLVWRASLILFVLSMVAHLGITRVDGLAIYLARVMFMVSIAGAFGASLTYVSLMAPQNRMAEMIGMLGSSGFLGLALGPTLGDWMFDVPEITRQHVHRMFQLAALMGGISLLFASIATRKQVRSQETRQPPLLWLVRRYHPGVLLLVGAAMGLGVGLPHTFLKAYAAELDITRIKTYFLVYACTAFVVRVSCRRLTDRVGVRVVIVLGFVCLATSMLLYMLVTDQWSMAIPAVMAGVAHALLFPAVIAGGSVSFPSRYRGLATTLMLAMFDVGNLVGQPLVGVTLHYCRHWGLPAYPIMFASVAAVLLLIAAVYLLRTGRSPAAEPQPAARSRTIDQREGNLPREQTAPVTALANNDVSSPAVPRG